ncbi:MAG: adenylate cyclase regulatory domain-containing protein [Acidimicrobiales bacterium]
MSSGRGVVEAPRPDDPDASAEDRRSQAMARVRSLLLDLGAGEEEIDAAIADDTVDLLMVDRMLVPAERRMTQGEIAARTGIPLDFAKRIWRALGFLDVGDDDPAFTEMDIEALHLFQGMMAMGLVDVESGLQMARVIGSSMARIAEAETSPGSTPILVPSGDSVIDADEFARSAGASLPAMARLLEYVWRRHLQAATRRAMLIRLRGDIGGISPVMTVGFADMVGFTMLSQHLGERQLAEVVSRFEEVAHDTVTSLGGRVVKMIGDEAMFVVPTVSDAANIGLTLAEAYADDELLSDVRVALAAGPVLVQDGDFYGPVVNLASRLVGIAHPGTVLMSDELHAALELEAPGEFESTALRPRSVKDIGRVQAWKLSRRGSAPGADRRRIMRWERLGEVLRELDELRDRGEKVVSPSSRRTAHRGDDHSVEAEGGDTVGPEFQPPFERDEGTAP